MDLARIFFDGWDKLLRSLILSAAAYPAMLLLVRAGGHRTLSQLNAFDLIVTVALGSTLASVITSADTALAQGVLCFAMLVALQFALAKTARASPRAERSINGAPVLLLCRGALLRDALSAARVTDDEVRAAVRAARLGDLEAVEAVVLETNGQLSVVPSAATATGSALAGVGGYAPLSAR